jgi:hypothetical protein
MRTGLPIFSQLTGGLRLLGRVRRGEGEEYLRKFENPLPNHNGAGYTIRIYISGDVRERVASAALLRVRKRRAAMLFDRNHIKTKAHSACEAMETPACCARSEAGMRRTDGVLRGELIATISPVTGDPLGRSEVVDKVSEFFATAARCDARYHRAPEPCRSTRS